MYSTWRSVESAGYCDLSFLPGREIPLRFGVFWAEDGVDGVRELLTEGPRCGARGAAPVGIPLRTEGFDGILVDGKEDNEACLWEFAVTLPVVPLVDGRYERTEVMAAGSAVEKAGKMSRGRRRRSRGCHAILPKPAVNAPQLAVLCCSICTEGPTPSSAKTRNRGFNQNILIQREIRDHESTDMSRIVALHRGARLRLRETFTSIPSTDLRQGWGMRSLGIDCIRAVHDPHVYMKAPTFEHCKDSNALAV